MCAHDTRETFIKIKAYQQSEQIHMNHFFRKKRQAMYKKIIFKAKS